MSYRGCPRAIVAVEWLAPRLSQTSSFPIFQTCGDENVHIGVWLTLRCQTPPVCFFRHTIVTSLVSDQSLRLTPGSLSERFGAMNGAAMGRTSLSASTPVKTSPQRSALRKPLGVCLYLLNCAIRVCQSADSCCAESRRRSHRSNEAGLSVDLLPNSKPSTPMSSSRSGQWMP